MQYKGAANNQNLSDFDRYNHFEFYHKSSDFASKIRQMWLKYWKIHNKLPNKRKVGDFYLDC